MADDDKPTPDLGLIVGGILFAGGLQLLRHQFGPKPTPEQSRAREAKRQADRTRRAKARAEEENARREARIDPNEVGLEEAIFYHPKREESIHPEPHYPYRRMIDDVTGYRLYETGTFSMPGHESWFSGWVVRDSSWKTVLYFAIRTRENRNPGIFDWRSATEIVHAHRESFFPFEDSLYPADFSFERIATMLAFHDGRNGGTVIDNRSAYRDRNQEAARLRRLSGFLPANFEYNPMMARIGAEVFYPETDSARYDAKERASIASDGSRLIWGQVHWSTERDRDGKLPTLNAKWTDVTGERDIRIAMTPMRAYREGYGETRAVSIHQSREFLGMDAHRPLYGAVSRSELPGEVLADLTNASVPIAGEHVGHMIIVDSRDTEPKRN